MRLIDADALLKNYKGSILTAQTDYAQGARDIIDDIRNAPTVDAVERKKGKWIDKSTYCVCNQCGHTEQQFNGVEPISLHTPSCAMCGADMRGERKDE